MVSKVSSTTRALLWGLMLSVALAPAAYSQGTGVVRGRVIDAAGARPLGDVSITIVGTQFGALTNANGDYAISNVPAGAQTVVARRIGYARATQPVQVTTDGDVRADFRLNQAAAQLDAMVVTGTAGAAEKRTIGNAITQLDVADVTSQTSLSNVAEVLQSRAPGVAVMSGSGTPGTGSDITIRGYGSLTTNRPVVYIDGVRMDIDNLGNWGPSGAGTTQFSGQTTSALDQINPQDIESIEVIRGPAASTLYGADAASGVIQIITKRGKRGQQPLRWTTRFETGWQEWGAGSLTNYTRCTAARKALVDAAGAPTWPGCQGKADNEIISDTPFERTPGALRNGDLQTITTSLRGGGDNFSYYASMDLVQNQGILLNSSDDRRSIRTNFALSPSNVLNVDINVSYLRSRLKLPLGDEAANGLLLSGARGIPGLAPPIGQPAERAGWGTINPELANRYNNQTLTDRIILGTTVTYSPFQWLRNRLTAGMDYRTSLARVLSLPGDPDVPAGLNAERIPRARSITLDYVGSGTARVRSDLESISSLGAQVSSRLDETLFATGSQLPTREITVINAALSINAGNSYSEFNSVGVYFQEQLAWKNRLYLTGAVRADDHSSFGTDFDIIAYPKASVSYVISEEPRFRSIFDRIRADNFRLRAAWGLAGRAPAPFSATQSYTSGRVALGPSTVGGRLTTNTFGNPNLKPEKGEEFELGFDSDYLGGRAGLEFTYYSKTMRDLLVPLALPPSLGFGGSVLQNIGKTKNRGLEMSLGGTPVSMARVVWDARLNFSWNRNRLTVLDSLRTEEFPGGASFSPGMQRNRVGYPLGSYFLRYPMKDANGNYMFTGTLPNLVPVYDTAFKFLGPGVPTRLWSLSNTFTLFRDWKIYGLLDHQGGHYMFNYKEYNRCALVANGPNCARLNAAPVVNDSVRALWGSVGTPTTITAPMTQTLYVEKADFVKLRDLSLSYTVPQRWARRARLESAVMVLSGHNLALWTDYTGLDPEVNGYGNNVTRGSGNNAQFARVDAYSMPMTRRYSAQFFITY
jgi:TonB-linked SusC/RagA family outer membrane protein